MKPKPLPDAALLRALIDYDPATGAMTWRTRPVSMFESGKYPAARAASAWNNRMANTPALAAPTANGYLHGAIGYGSFLAHRVAWKIVTGDEPDDVDHINGVRTDNRFCNLRSCRRSENMRNRGLSRNNKSGAHGVWQEARTGKWCAQIERAGVVTDLGRHDSFPEAERARKAAERRLGFHPNHGAREGHAMASANLES